MPIERPSDREYLCFFCFDGKTKDQHAHCPTCGKSIDISPYLEGQSVDNYSMLEFIGRGYYGFTFRAENRIKKPFALKLVPKRLYEKHDKSFNEEISKYQKLGSHSNIAELIDAGHITLVVDDVEIEFYSLVMEWIEGISLTKYLEMGSAPTNEVFGAIVDIAAGLERFEHENLWHNDLNSDNIILKKLSEEEQRTRLVKTQFICKIIDIGSAVFRQSPQPGRLSDLAFLGTHINELRKVALASPFSLTREDEFFQESLDRVVSGLLDEDQTRGITSARQVILDVSEFYRQRHLLNESIDIELTNPFAYLNANDFPNDAYINYLFSGLFPWVSDILTPETQGTLVTGPRGSGKTMILRSMRLKTRLHSFKPEENAEEVRSRIAAEKQIAFYVSARIDIGNHCYLTKLPKWTNSQEFIVYYFFLLYTAEVLDTFCFGTAKSILEFDVAAERDFCQFICGALGLGNSLTIDNTLRQVRLKQSDIERDSLGSLPGGILLNSTFLSELSQNLTQLSPLFSNKGVTFLLDDFSLPKVPEKIQQVLLPLIWNSGGGYSFRVSAHSESVVSKDIRGIRYQRNREYREINLGANYLNSMDVNRNESAIEAYVGDIFRKRFSVSQKKFKTVTLEQLLGPDYEGKIAEEIKTRKKNKTLHGLHYHGRNTLIKLCSGDISYLIDMLGQMLRTTDSFPVSVEHQHRVIKQYAWQELYRLNDFPTTHCNLFDIALNFGKFSLFKLLGKEVSPGRPAEYLRVEVALESEQDQLRLVIAELLQNGVFVDGGFSNSSQQMPARRLLFRKIFTPAFPTTYNSRDTFAMTTRHFLDFAAQPDRFVRAKLGEEGVKPEDQQLELDNLVDRIS